MESQQLVLPVNQEIMQLVALLHVVRVPVEHLRVQLVKASVQDVLLEHTQPAQEQRSVQVVRHVQQMDQFKGPVPPQLIQSASALLVTMVMD